LDAVRDDIKAHKSSSLFQVEKYRIGLSSYGQDLVDSIDNLKKLIGLFSKNSLHHNIIIDTAKYCDSLSSDELSDRKEKEKKKPVHKKRKRSRSSLDSTKEHHRTSNSKESKKKMKPEEETSHSSNSSKETQSITTSTPPLKIPQDGLYVWINGIPKNWNNNFYIRKKIKRAIRTKFEINIEEDEIRKDPVTNLWILPLGSADDLAHISGQSLPIEEGTDPITFASASTL